MGDFITLVDINGRETVVHKDRVLEGLHINDCENDTQISEHEQRPPLGIIPMNLFEESCNRERILDLVKTIQRYSNSGSKPLKEWFDELESRIAIVGRR